MAYSKAAGRIGEERRNAQGAVMRIVAYRSVHDVDVLFPDTGEVRRGTTYGRFASGRVKCRSFPSSLARTDRVGESRVNSQGLRMEICGYRNINDIDVRFEDGTVVAHRKYERFLDGRIVHPGFPSAQSKTGRVGELIVNRQGVRMEIVAYRSCVDIDVKCCDWHGTVLRGVDYSRFSQGLLRDPFVRSEYGVGYIGDGPYTGRTHGKAYRTWRSLLARCYDPGDKSYRQFGKRGVAVCAEWHCFQDFCTWYEAHYYDPSQDLVPDIDLKGGMSYGPDTCVMVPVEIRQFLRPRGNGGKARGLPIGTYRSGRMYRAHIAWKDARIPLGSFDTAGEAHGAYLSAKADMLDRYAEELDGRLSDEAREAFAGYRKRLRAEAGGWSGRQA